MAGSDSNKGRILVIDDEQSIRDILFNLLTGEGFKVDLADDGDVGIRKLESNTYDIVITDLKMERIDGLQVLRSINELNGHTMGIVATGYGSIDSAIEALRLGAFDYITKPFHLDEIKILMHKAREFQTLTTENQNLKRELKRSSRQDAIIGKSLQMEELNELIRTVADSDSTILVLGESGTGKELVARGIHQHSDRGEEPLIPVNCGAIPEDLLESELFGHIKGAFTGATMNRIGRFEMANGGTIFLDEIGEMSPKLQVKLLRVLQEQTFEPVGATQTVQVNVRIIAATNRDLEKDVEEGRFREDLFYRLNVIPLIIPPLRERIDDIPLLMAHFTEQFNKTKGRKISGFSGDAQAILLGYNWPGNVRELENLVERMAILNSEGEIGVEQLPEKFREGVIPIVPSAGTLVEMPDSGINFNKLVEQFEAHLIKLALEKAGGTKNRAAGYLKMKRTTFVEKMRKRGFLD
jgi:DNA-binding NtrC family response regulator